MLQTRLHENPKKRLLNTSSFPSFLLLYILIISMLIAYAPNAMELAAAAKLDDQYPTSFNTVPFPSFLKFDPYEEYRHVVFDRTVTIMGKVLLDGIGSGSIDTERNFSATSQHAPESPRAQESQQLTSNKGIQTQLRQPQIQVAEQGQDQLGVTNQESFLGPIYSVSQTAIPGINNQEKMVSRSPWFPSVPAYFCDGEYSLVIKGTASLDLYKLKKANQYDVTIKILADKLGPPTTEGHEGVTGILGIADHEYLQDNFFGKDIDTNENNRVINSSDASHDLPLDISHLDIEKIQNGCRVHVYNAR
jgi:hypothetical protein